MAIPAFGYFIVWIIDRISEAIKDIFSEANSSDKKLYIFLTIVISLIVMLLYFNENLFFSSTGATFGTDQGRNYNYALSNLNNYDIRHPLFEALYFPIYSVIKFVVNIFVSQNLRYEITNFIIQEASIQFSLLSAFILKKLTGSKTIFWLYCLSFSFVFYVVITEKYNLAIFFALLYIFYMFKKPNKSTEKLIGATGIMPTSALLGVLELTMVKGRKIKDMVIRVFEVVLKTILTMICFGKICFFDPFDFHMLPDGSTYVVKYLTTNTTLTQKLISFTKLVKNAFFCLNSNGTPGEKYIWQSTLENVEILSIFIIIIMLIGFIYKRKEAFTKICGLWALFSFAFVVIIGWSPVESPIFSFYFLWAFVPLVKYGIDCIGKLLRFKSSYVFAFIIIMMTIADVAVIADINTFLQTL